MKKTLSFLIASSLLVSLATPVQAAKTSKNDALTTALKDAWQTKSSVRGIEVETDDDTGHYEVEFETRKNRVEYGYEISGDTGVILEKTVDYNLKYSKTGKMIGKKKAISNVAKFSKISSGVIENGTCKYSKGKYTIRFQKGNIRYEYDVVGKNGKIDEYEWEKTA